jgi:hypothetical protein
MSKNDATPVTMEECVQYLLRANKRLIDLHEDLHAEVQRLGDMGVGWWAPIGVAVLAYLLGIMTALWAGWFGC